MVDGLLESMLRWREVNIPGCSGFDRMKMGLFFFFFWTLSPGRAHIGLGGFLLEHYVFERRNSTNIIIWNRRWGEGRNFDCNVRIA